MRFPVWVLALVGCKGEDPEKLLDTGWFEDSADYAEGCPHRIATTRPEDGDTGWYWRAAPRIVTGSADTERYAAWLVDDAGNRPAADLIWDDGGQAFEIRTLEPLRPATAYTLSVLDCQGQHDFAFTTSALGTPLEGGAAALQGRTFSIDLGSATWLEPGGVAPILTLFLDAPVLIGVPLSTDDTLHMSLALGIDDGGTIVQDPSEQAIPFPLVDFDQQPFFEAEVPTVDLDFSGAQIPVYGFAFSGTFAPDGSSIGGGTIRGIGDTRFAGTLLGSSQPDEVCTTAAGLGVQCSPCPNDGEPFCLPVNVADVVGQHVPGLTLQAQ